MGSRRAPRPSSAGRSAYRWYISYSPPANSAASCPPVPARISTSTSLSSLGSFGNQQRLELRAEVGGAAFGRAGLRPAELAGHRGVRLVLRQVAPLLRLPQRLVVGPVGPHDLAPAPRAACRGRAAAQGPRRPRDGRAPGSAPRTGARSVASGPLPWPNDFPAASADRRPRSGGVRDLGLGGTASPAFASTRKHLLERRDGHLDLVAVRRLRRDLLQPQARAPSGPA